MTPWAGFPLTADGAETPGHGPDGVLPVSVPEASEVVSDPAPSSQPKIDDGAATPPAEGTGVVAPAAAESATGATNTGAAPSSPLLFELVRTRDISGVSGTGVVADGVQFADDSVAIRWRGEHPATAVWPTIADVLAVHGHHGATTVRWLDQPAKLVRAYQLVTKWLRSSPRDERLIDVTPHPVYGDRLLLTFTNEAGWRFWIALFDGSTDTAIQEQTGLGTEHRWVSPDGLLWLSWIDLETDQ